MTKQKRLSVLLVEDNMANVFLQKRILTKLGCTESITVASTGQAAYDLVQAAAEADPAALPDLIFLDLNLPAMNGWEFMEQYNQLPLPPERKPRVLILTYSEYENDRLRAGRTPGVSGFYNKPLTVPLLEEILGKYFPGMN